MIVVTHDEELLQNCVDILWHINDGKITIFRGNYLDYMNELHAKRQSVLHQMHTLKIEKIHARKNDEGAVAWYDVIEFKENIKLMD